MGLTPCLGICVNKSVLIVGCSHLPAALPGAASLLMIIELFPRECPPSFWPDMFFSVLVSVPLPGWPIGVAK